MFHEWEHIVCNLLRLAFLTKCIALETQLVLSVAVVNFFLLLSSIPSYGWTEFVQPFTYGRTFRFSNVLYNNMNKATFNV